MKWGRWHQICLLNWQPKRVPLWQRATKATTPMLAANLAASTAGAVATDTMSVEAVMEKAIDTLLTYRSGFAGLHPGS